MKGFFTLIAVASLIFLSGCYEEKDPTAVPTHPTGWTSSSSADFHGSAVLSKSFSKESCQSCHGEDYQGGTSGVSCYSSGCHSVYPHPIGFGDAGSANFHNNFIADVQSWDILNCQSCHGTDYAGKGVSDKNCLTCHTKSGGPENCMTCHGSGDNPAPPRDLNGNTDVSFTTVGAHQAHLTGEAWSTVSTGTCRTCHQAVGSYSASGHIDDTPHSEVIFNELARAVGGTLEATWSRNDASCSDVYCHGGFELRRDDSQYPWAYTEEVMSGNNQEVFWKFVGTGQAVCGSCHGLPPAGHIPATDCSGCHNSVVDENLNIINKDLHINGRIEVF